METNNKEEILNKNFKHEFGHKGHGKFMGYILKSMDEYANQQTTSQKQTIERLRDQLETIKIGMEWNMENKPEVMDKADYEQYDNICELLNTTEPTNK